MTRPRIALVLAVLTVIAAVLRAINLDGGLWFDEIVTLVMFTRPPLASIVTESSRHATPAPRRSSTSLIVRQSWMRGTLRSSVRPGASSAAAMSFNAEFLAPATRTVPEQRAPPVTRSRSIGAVSLGPIRAGTINPRARSATPPCSSPGRPCIRGSAPRAR